MRREKEVCTCGAVEVFNDWAECRGLFANPEALATGGDGAEVELGAAAGGDHGEGVGALSLCDRSSGDDGSQSGCEESLGEHVDGLVLVSRGSVGVSVVCVVVLGDDCGCECV